MISNLHFLPILLSKPFPVLTYGGCAPLPSTAETVLRTLLLWGTFPRGDMCLSNSWALYHLIYSHTCFTLLYLSKYPWKPIGKISVSTYMHTLTHIIRALWFKCRFPVKLRKVLVGLLLWEGEDERTKFAGWHQ